MVRPVESDRSVRLSSLASFSRPPAPSFLLSSIRTISLLVSLLSLLLLHSAHDWSSLAFFPPSCLSFFFFVLFFPSLPRYSLRRALLQHVYTTFAHENAQSAHISTGTTRCIEGRIGVDSAFAIGISGARLSRKRTRQGAPGTNVAAIRTSHRCSPGLWKSACMSNITTSRRNRKVGDPRVGPLAAFFAALSRRVAWDYFSDRQPPATA